MPAADTSHVWRTTAQLTPAERTWIEAFVADKPWYDFYLRSALRALADGQDNRFYHLGRARRGLLMGIRFDRFQACSLVGELDDDEVRSVLSLGDRLEIHASEEQAGRLASCRPGLMRNRIVYYRLLGPAECRLDPRCRLLTANQLELTRAFYEAHYPQAVFSAWMLDDPFIGVFERDQLVAAAGTITVEPALGTCLVGNFLTHPQWRGRGLGMVAGRGLLELVRRRGLHDLRLAVNSDNEPARRLYEGLGFTALEEREMLVSLAPTFAPP